MTRTNQPNSIGEASLTTQKRAGTRRGSMLVLAVGVLAVLAVMAVSYVTVVRIDRRSSDAYQEQENLQQQVVAATAYLQAILAADLFGGVNVNSNTPRQHPRNLGPNWPKAFLDGEFWDYPWTDLHPTNSGATLSGVPNAFTWDTAFASPTNPTPQPSNNSRLDLTGDIGSILIKRPYPDDAWLSPIEPIDTGNNSGEGAEWDTWPQITNLRSMFRWVRQPGYIGYARDDGRYVDLVQFLLQEAPGTSGGVRQGHPGAFLSLDRSGQPWVDPLTNQRNGPWLGINQTVFDLQMADLQEELYPYTGLNIPPGTRERQPADERFWADTDGDGRPDARWQELDVFANAYGMRWVIAARIIDNSALANVNSHLNFMNYASNWTHSFEDYIGDGRTPADVDLFRLIASQVFYATGYDPTTGGLAPTAHPDIPRDTIFDFNQGNPLVSALGRSWHSHLVRGLHAPGILQQLHERKEEASGNFVLGEPYLFLNEPWPSDGGALFGAPQTWPLATQIPPLELRRFERAHIWRYFGSNPFNPFASTGSAYPLTDDIDLRAQNGFNRLNLISKLEQRLDYSAGPNFFLPGLQPSYSSASGRPALGPMRSKEWDNFTDSPRTFKDFMVLPGEDSAGNYIQADKLERLRKDIRHLLTTISGEGRIGPVPVLNAAAKYQQLFATQKVQLSAFVNDPGTTPNVNRIRQPLEDAFAAFVWALAPLATNQPIMTPLDQMSPFAYAQLARDADLHYGGGVDGPATAVAPLYGLSPSTPGGPDDIGAAYAILRALSLAVNLVDAIDAHTSLGSSPTIEEPSIVRFFNQPDINDFFAQNQSTLEDVVRYGAIHQGVRFPQGDITSNTATTPPLPDTDALPVEVVGDPQHGLTLIGLDRQPFLVQALTLVVYSNDNANENADVNADTQLDPAEPSDVLGSLFAVELGNPWTEDLELKEYVVRISDGGSPASVLELDFTGGNFTDSTGSTSAGAIIPAGQTVVFYFFSDVPPEARPSAAAEWDTVQDEILNEFVGNGAFGDGGSTRRIDSGLGGSAFGSGAGDIFKDFAGGSFPVLLTRRLIVTDSAGNPMVVDLLVDRLSPPSTTDPFPATLDDVVDGSEFGYDTSPGSPNPITTLAMRFAVQSSLRRPSEPSSTGGFPMYVIERPGNNAHVIHSHTIDPVGHAWTFNETTGAPVDPKPITDITDEIKALGELELLALPKPNDGMSPLEPGAFELFVPNGPLFATSELGQLCAFTHMFIHDSSSVPDIEKAVDTSGPLGPGKWVTISEQLGWDAHLNYATSSTSGGNPHFGTLDFSRFVLNSNQSSIGSSPDLGPLTTSPELLPDALAVPLATRVFDAFEALPAGQLVHGRINVNTAPRRILELLPFVDPYDPFNSTTPSIAGWTTSHDLLSNPNNTRSEWLKRYRDRNLDGPGLPLVQATSGDRDQSAPERFTNFPGLRVPGTLAPWSLGLVNKGELATLGRWSGLNDGLLDGQSSPGTPANAPAFLELGANGGLNDAMPLDLRPQMSFEAADDAEERLAIFRAISNIVSTRSDIFTAWYLLRAYDPKDIEAISIAPGLSDEQIADLMNPNSQFAQNPDSHPGLLPAWERRILVIFDRSNVRRPTDRPKVLLQVELPVN